MRHESLSPQNTPVSGEAVKLVLGIAKQLHKAAKSDSLAISLPVLRRVIATETLRDISLVALNQSRSMVQRKHILRTLAIEAGYTSWESYRQALSNMAPSDLEHFDLIRSASGYPNLWFSTPEKAAEYADSHGGRVVRVGDQAVVVAEAAAQNDDGPDREK